MTELQEINEPYQGSAEQTHALREGLAQYVEDLVRQPSFAKCMREYAEEGIQHFYFILLLKDEVSYPLADAPFGLVD